MVNETKISGKLSLLNCIWIYLLLKRSSSGYNTVSNATAEFSDDALQNSSRNWYDDLLDSFLQSTNSSRKFFCWFNLSYNPKDKNLSGSDLVGPNEFWLQRDQFLAKAILQPLHSHLLCVCRCSMLHEHRLARIIGKDFDVSFFGYLP